MHNWALSPPAPGTSHHAHHPPTSTSPHVQLHALMHAIASWSIIEFVIGVYYIAAILYSCAVDGEMDRLMAHSSDIDASQFVD